MTTAPKHSLIAFLPVTLILVLFSPVLAQRVEQIAYNLEIKDSSGEAGDIISYSNGVYELSTKEYDPGIYGVIVADPQLTLNQTTPTTKAVITNGQALVKVSQSNGSIKAGDLLTTSKDKGIGQKATKSGHVLGKALKDFPNTNSTKDEGLIPVTININYNQISAKSESLTQSGINEVASKVSSAVISGNIPSLLKYIFALLLGSISFFVGLTHFVRQNRTGVEAIARNPLAKKDIQRQIFVGTAGILFVSAIGLAIAIFILFFL